MVNIWKREEFFRKCAECILFENVMALRITEQCINCDMCTPECPNDAIAEGTKTYEIDVLSCTECVGFYENQTCVDVCPINCIEQHPEYQENKQQLLEKFKALSLFGTPLASVSYLHTS